MRLSAAFVVSARLPHRRRCDARLPPARHQARTPIKHLITILQENHTYDNYFGTYPRGDGLPPERVRPGQSGTAEAAAASGPFHIGDNDVLPRDLDHSQATFRLQYDGGRLDGFVHALNARNQDGRLALGYRDGRDVRYYWNLADKYVLYDRFFSSASAGSFLNHIYWVAGQAGRTATTAFPPSRLQEPHHDLRPAGGGRRLVEVLRPELRPAAQLPVAAELPRQPRVAGDLGAAAQHPALPRRPEAAQRTSSTSTSTTTTCTTARSRPSPTSPPPARASIRPSSIQSGQAFVADDDQRPDAQPEWKSSAFLLAYDDWGGWYDHVKPPQVDRHGYGFRVPALLVSPYAKRGVVDNTTLDFTSILRFIEDNWDLKPLATRDATREQHRLGLRLQQGAASRRVHVPDARYAEGVRRQARSDLRALLRRDRSAHRARRLGDLAEPWPAHEPLAAGEETT